MIYKLSIPDVAEDVTEFRLLEWHGEAGSAFGSGELVVELETHKAIIEVRAGQAGVFRQILIPAGGWCEINVPIALFGDDMAEPLPQAAEAAADLRVDYES